jgi:putative copper resistance protein D
MDIILRSLMPFIDLTALSSLVGAVLCLFWTVCPVLEGSPTKQCSAGCRQLLLFCLVGLSISSIGILVQRAMVMAGLGITEIAPVLPTVLLSSHYGSMWFVRAAGIVVVWGVWCLGKRRLNSRIVTSLLLISCAAIAFSRSATSHGADHGDFSLEEFSDWFHLLASISWGGALLSISIMFSASKVADNAEQQHIVSGIADRFYVLFGPVFAVLVFTGLYNAWVDVGSFGALLTNTYGRLLSVKLLIFAYLTSRYIAPPQKGKDEAAYVTKFLKRSRVEAFLILAILLFVSLFTQEVPARHAVHMLLLERQQRTLSNPGTSTDRGTSQRKEHANEQSLLKMTANGLYSVQIAIKDKDLKVGVNTFDISVHDKNGKEVTGAEIDVVPWMPEMGHGVFDKPVVKEKGGGTYSVENVILIMGGQWELRLKIRNNSVESYVTFSLQVT